MNIKLIASIDGVIFGYLFEPKQVVTIGRELGNTIAPIVDNLSRHHAKIYYRDGDWYAEDAGSTNGSYRNGEKIEGAVKLIGGDSLRFGLIDMTVGFVADVAMPESPVAEMEPVADLPAAQPLPPPPPPPPPPPSANGGVVKTLPLMRPAIVKPGGVGAALKPAAPAALKPAGAAAPAALKPAAAPAASPLQAVTPKPAGAISPIKPAGALKPGITPMKPLIKKPGTVAIKAPLKMPLKVVPKS